MTKESPKKPELLCGSEVDLEIIDPNSFEEASNDIVQLETLCQNTSEQGFQMVTYAYCKICFMWLNVICHQ